MAALVQARPDLGRTIREREARGERGEAEDILAAAKAPPSSPPAGAGTASLSPEEQKRPFSDFTEFAVKADCDEHGYCIY